MSRRSALLLVAAASTGVAMLSGGRSVYLTVKAEVSQHLLKSAWQQSVVTGDIVKPWSWADTWPVAHLTVPAFEQSLIVLEGSFGEAIAFGPGRIAESSTSAATGIFAVGGHRDTHLAFLQHIKKGTEILLQTRDTVPHRYSVKTSFVLDSRTESITIDPDQHGLVLITCYPFNALQTGGPLRYVVTATHVDNT